MGKAYAHSFTVFTATYNRKHTLPAVYACLRAQTYKDFEWLIVDDGSTDGTADLVESWRTQACIPIRYFYQGNSGKHVAYNVGVREARGELFLPLDSDDTCVPEALARLKDHWDAIPDGQKAKFSAVTVLCVDDGGKVIGDRFPNDVMDSDSVELFYRFKVKGDKWGFQRIDVLREFPFPSIPGTKFLPEGIVWNAIAKSYKTRFVNEGLLVVGTKYPGHDQRLTEGLPTQSSAKGMAIWHARALNEEIGWFWHAPISFFRSAVHYVRFRKLAGLEAWDSRYYIEGLAARLLTWLAWPVGWLIYLKDRRLIRLNASGGMGVRRPGS